MLTVLLIMSYHYCVQQAKNAAGSSLVSNNQPSGNTTGDAFATADGYVWKFLYCIGALTAAKFLSSNFLPVTFIETKIVKSNINTKKS